LYSNLPFTLSLVLLILTNLYFTIPDSNWLSSLLHLWPFPVEVKVKIGVIVVVNSVVTYLYEAVVVWYVTNWWKEKKDQGRLQRQNQELHQTLQKYHHYLKLNRQESQTFSPMVKYRNEEEEEGKSADFGFRKVYDNDDGL